jgi:hypothetical protein
MTTLVRPTADEHAAFYSTYVDAVPEGELLAILDEQRTTMRELLGHLPPDRGGYRYGPDKWTILQVIVHLSDAERIFAYRALRIARKDTTPLAKWDENAYAEATETDDIPVAVALDDWEAARTSTLSMFRTFPESAWERRGIASDHVISARALAYIVAGHTAHHIRILRERYGVR